MATSKYVLKALLRLDQHTLCWDCPSCWRCLSPSSLRHFLLWNDSSIPHPIDSNGLLLSAHRATCTSPYRLLFLPVCIRTICSRAHHLQLLAGLFIFSLSSAASLTFSRQSYRCSTHINHLLFAGAILTKLVY